MTLDDAIDEIVRIGHQAAHHNERLPWDLVTRLVRYGDDEPEIPEWGIGLLALCVGVANWGARVPAITVPVRDGPDITRSGIVDPARRDWAGPRKKSGKHLLDGTHHAPYGGLSLPHWDSGALADWYEQWGRPDVGHLPKAPLEEWRFDDLRRAGGRIWERWLDWSTALLKRPEVHRWSIREWLAEMWTPSWRASKVESGALPGSDLATNWERPWSAQVNAALINARIRNSAKSWAKRWAHLSADRQAERYIEAKRESRGDHAATRAERQVSFVRRAQVLVEAAKLEAL